MSVVEKQAVIYAKGVSIVSWSCITKAWMDESCSRNDDAGHGQFLIAYRLPPLNGTRQLLAATETPRRNPLPEATLAGNVIGLTYHRPGWQPQVLRARANAGSCHLDRSSACIPSVAIEPALSCTVLRRHHQLLLLFLPLPPCAPLRNLSTQPGSLSSYALPYSLDLLPSLATAAQILASPAASEPTTADPPPPISSRICLLRSCAPRSALLFSALVPRNSIAE
ncbi:hypothetical protein HDV57DRAFT_164359 [Trichoderma longibrachiatum]